MGDFSTRLVRPRRCEVGTASLVYQLKQELPVMSTTCNSIPSSRKTNPLTSRAKQHRRVTTSREVTVYCAYRSDQENKPQPFSKLVPEPIFRSGFQLHGNCWLGPSQIYMLCLKTKIQSDRIFVSSPPPPPPPPPNPPPPPKIQFHRIFYKLCRIGCQSGFSFPESVFVANGAHLSEVIGTSSQVKSSVPRLMAV